VFDQYYSFGRTQFAGAARFAGARFSETPDLSEASFARPPEW